MPNMKRSCHISLFRVGFFLLLSLLIKHPIVYILSFAYLLTDNTYDAIAYAMALIVSINLFARIDLLPVGIVDYRRNDYAVVNKLFYKVKIHDECLRAGDVLFFKNNLELSANQSDLAKGILYAGSFDGTIIFSFGLKAHLYQLIESFDKDIASLYFKIFYGFHDDYAQFYSFSLGFGGYYLGKIILRANRTLGTFCIAIYSLLFCFDIRFCFLLIDTYSNLERKELFGLKLIIIGMADYHLFSSSSIQFILFASFLGIIDTDFDFKTLFAVFQSYLFGSFDLIDIYIYKYLLIFRSVVFAVALLGLLFRPFQCLLISTIELSDKLFEIFNIEIRGSVSIISLIIFLLIRKIIKLKMDMILLVMLILSPFNKPFFNTAFIDVGQGDAVLINCPFSACHILYDTGSSYNYNKLNRKLKSEGIYVIDYLIISHDDEDHSGNLSRLGDDFKIENTILEGRSFMIGGIVFDYLDLGTFDNDNDNSLVYDVSYKQKHILLTGDISQKAEAILIKKYGRLKADILKVSHHGSRTSSSSLFISRIEPCFSIISTNGRYGHPDEETIEVLRKYQSRIFITKESGDISFVFTNIFHYLKTASGDFVIIR